MYRIGLMAFFCIAGVASATASTPNVIVIFADDLGYGDLGCYGSPTIRTPRLDELASAGVRFTDFYSAAEVCTPSRAALLTGRYPIRSGMCGARRVLFPNSSGGLPQSEKTISTCLQGAGYRTMHIGKWHLGIHPGSRPLDHGFEHSFGLPYSNDMDARAGLPKGSTGSPTPPEDGWNVPLIRDGVVIEQPAIQSTLTKRYTDEAVRFVLECGDQPYFLYFAHTFPHVPLFASEEFKGRSRQGIYGDAVEELDWSVGEILDAVRSSSGKDRTLIVFTSDNGPWLTMGNQGGNAGPLRDGKGSTWEGGMRVPAIAWMPSQIQPHVSSEVVSALDLFPTVMALTGVPVNGDAIIDGRDLTSMLFDNAPLPEMPFFYYRGDQLFACRLGEWKMHLQTQIGYGQPKAESHDPPLLFHLGLDVSEKRDVAARHPEIVLQLQQAIDAHQADLLTGVPQLK